VTGPFELGAIGGAGAPFGIERANLKFFPSEYHSQAPLFLALDLRNKVKIDEIEAIDVQTYYTAWSEIGSEPAKWDPKTRETADHSLAYLLALGFVDGRITAESFSDERIRDGKLRPLMQRIRVSENKDYTREFPGKLMTRIEVTPRGGERVSGLASYPKGHAKNPMSDADLEAKFDDLSHGVLAAGGRTLLQALWNVEQSAHIGETLALCAVR
jgi:2-methylcitrate dehydratase